MTFNELYHRLVKAELDDRTPTELESIRESDFNPHHLDCLLRPDQCAPVWRLGNCTCSDESKTQCGADCLFNAIGFNEHGDAVINRDMCAGCGDCIDRCKAHNLTDRKDVIAALASIKSAKGPVYAMIAPAFIGQFSREITPGKLRSAFKRLGFSGMVEVALFADILTLRESLEFDRTIVHDEDFLLTSCCCPMWIAMIRRIYKQFVPHVPGSVSPMIACGRSIKLLEPNSVTIFIGPCVAKKAEAREPDIADAVDFVLTFEEVRELFDFAGIHPEALEDDARDHSSTGGRIYARTGGVSEAVTKAVERLNPDRTITVHARKANGIRECKEMMNALKDGAISENFIEGMGCVGGCVGGPKAILDPDEGRKNVNEYGKQATYETPIDNPYVIDLLHRLGFKTVDKLLEDNCIFTRHFQ